MSHRPVEALREAVARPSRSGRREVHRTASRNGKKHYRYTAIDDCTRLRVLRIYPRNDHKTAIQFLDYALEKRPFRVEVVQTDNGAEFQGALQWHLLDRGIGHVYIKPATPRLNGKVERSHRIDAEEFYRMLDGVVIDDTVGGLTKAVRRHGAVDRLVLSCPYEVGLVPDAGAPLLPTRIQKLRQTSRWGSPVFLANASR